MKRILFGLLGAMLLFTLSCQKSESTAEAQREPEQPSAQPLERTCASHELLEAQLAADPSFRERMNAIEAFTRRYAASRTTGAPSPTITIPVVVHVVYNTEEQNISDAQVQSQIDVLNEDFNLTNQDHTLVPQHFTDEKANVGIRFTLAQTIRKNTSKKSFGTDNGVKYDKRGGSNVVDPSKYLNIWVCNLGQNLLGYAQFPGGNPATDGVVILYSATGRTGTLIPNYNKGRTATHEVGHWANLRHIWGDATCGTDYVDDTPQHNTSNGGCPPADHRSTCAGTPLEMWMNYMDYTYDACMYMFTNNQSTRMHATFSGVRASMVQ